MNSLATESTLLQQHCHHAQLLFELINYGKDQSGINFLPSSLGRTQFRSESNIDLEASTNAAREIGFCDRWKNVLRW